MSGGCGHFITRILFVLLSGHWLSIVLGASLQEQVDLVRTTIEHDGCKRFGYLAKKDDPTFMLANATCFSVCTVVADLHKERHPTLSRVTVGGECKHSLTLQYMCMCQFTQGFFTWHSLRRTAKHFLNNIVDDSDYSD